MRTVKANTRRRPLWHTVLLAVLAIAFGGAATIAALAGLKVIDPAKLAFWRSKEAIPADWVAVPMCARPIPAYTKVTRDYLMNPKTVQWASIYLPPKAVPKGVIVDRLKILGRVTAREKPAEYAFKEEDFLPEGTSPGVAGGTPPGKLAITLDAGMLKGIVYDLQEGDHVVLQASTTVDMPGASHSNGGRSGTSVVATPNMTLLPKRSLVTTLVQDGVVVTPARTRNKPVSSTSLTQGMTTRTVPVQEIVIAVDPQEVPLLNEAMELKYEITCMVRSGRPAPVGTPASHPSDSRASQNGVSQIVAAIANAVLGKDAAAAPGKAVSAPSGKETAGPKKTETPTKNEVAMDLTPGFNPMDQIRFMEVMVGPQRQFMLFTGPGNSPVMASQDDGSAKAGSGAGAAETSKQ